MIKYITSILLPIFFLSSFSFAATPFTRGFNLAGWLEATSAQQVQFTRFTRQDFINIKNLGCDHIRLPIHLFNMSETTPDYAIDPLLFFFLDQIIDWAEELQLHLILDNHSFDVNMNTSPTILDQLISVWQQVAARYRDRSQLIYYEVLNEPHGIDDNTWNSMQQSVIDAIRSIDRAHTIIVGPAGWNSYTNLQYMPSYADSNLIYTFHFYDPFLFTHQGASWVNPPLDIAGVPFPYDPLRMPALPNKLKGTWIEGIYNGYKTNGTYGWVKSQLDIAVAFKNSRKVPLWCGEFGAFIPNSSTADRARWLELVRTHLEQNGIAWSMWEYADGFGIFEPYSNGLFDYDVNLPIIEALELIPPQQRDFDLLPDTTGFNIYDDYLGPNIIEESWIPAGILNYYSPHQPVVGDFCIYWSGVDQYGNISLRFAPIKDLSWLVEKGYAIDFWLRCATPAVRIDIRFVDTKTDQPDDHPWRMRYTIDTSVAVWNGSWQHLQIPLNKFTEHGSWDNDHWYEPRGKFDWTKIQYFQIVAEHHDLLDIEFYFDQIRIVDSKLVSVKESDHLPHQFFLRQNYPNPFNPTTKICYQLQTADEVHLVIYNILGKTVRTLMAEFQASGQHDVIWDGRDQSGEPVCAGMYIYQLQAGKEKINKKLVLAR